MTDTPQSFTTQFSEDFTFGDEGEEGLIFDPRWAVLNMRAGDERYLTFVSNQAFGRPDPEKPGDEGLPVRFCDNPTYGMEGSEGARLNLCTMRISRRPTISRCRA